MDLEKPAWSPPSVGFGDEVNVWIEKEPRFSSIQRNVHSHLHPKWRGTEPRYLTGEEAGKLPNHIRSPAHVHGLLEVQILLRSDSNLSTRGRIGNIEERARHVAFEHHLPTEAMLHVSPFDAAGIKEVTQRN